MKQTKAGFTLIEVLIAMSIFAIAALAAASLILQSTSMISVNAQHSQAVTLAQQTMEDLRTLSYDDVTSGAQTSTLNNTQYAVSWLVTANSPAPEMKKIILTVSWQNKGVAKNYALETVFTKVTS